MPDPIVPMGVKLSDDIEFRPDRPSPYRARVRWVDPITKKRPSVSEAFTTEEDAQAWIEHIKKAASRGGTPATATMTRASFALFPIVVLLRAPAASIHRRSVSRRMPRSRATWAIVRSGSEWYKATASTLNSGEYTFITISDSSYPAPTGAGIKGVHHSGGRALKRFRCRTEPA